MVELDEQKFADIGAKALIKFMKTADKEEERSVFMLCGLGALTIFGDMLFAEEGDNADGSKK